MFIFDSHSVSLIWLKKLFFNTFVPLLGGAATEIQEVCMAEVAFQTEKASSCCLFPNGPAL